MVLMHLSGTLPIGTEASAVGPCCDGVDPSGMSELPVVLSRVGMEAFSNNLTLLI